MLPRNVETVPVVETSRPKMSNPSWPVILPPAAITVPCVRLFVGRG